MSVGMSKVLVATWRSSLRGTAGEDPSEDEGFSVEDWLSIVGGGAFVLILLGACCCRVCKNMRLRMRRNISIERLAGRVPELQGLQEQRLRRAPANALKLRELRLETTWTENGRSHQTAYPLFIDENGRASCRDVGGKVWLDGVLSWPQAQQACDTCNSKGRTSRMYGLRTQACKDCSGNGFHWLSGKFAWRQTQRDNVFEGAGDFSVETLHDGQGQAEPRIVLRANCLGVRAPVTGGIAKSTVVGHAPLAADYVKTAESLASSASSRSDLQMSSLSLGGNPIAVLETSMGQVKVEVFLDRVPRTASNFIDLCKSGFYNGLHFHRVIPNFMNQFGCPYSKDPRSARAGTGGPPDGAFKSLKTGAVERRSRGGNIKDELVSKDPNDAGTLSMANTGQANTGGSQFFINVADNHELDWFRPGPSKHPVFGRVVEGYDIAVAISKAPTHEDCPVTPIRVHRIVVRGA